MTTITLRFDDKTKAAIDNLCENLGLSISNFFSIYAKKAIQEQRIPFSLVNTKRTLGEVCLDDLNIAHNDAIINGTANMSLEEINKEIYG